MNDIKILTERLKLVSNNKKDEIKHLIEIELNKHTANGNKIKIHEFFEEILKWKVSNKNEYDIFLISWILIFNKCLVN